MPDLTPNHPAVQVGCQAASEWVDDASADEPDHIARALHMTATCITAALPHLTADDLRHTDVAEEIRTEGWLQGWAAGRDLDGDEDATPYLRDTPAGRALMAEAWEEGVADNERGWQHVYAGHDIDPDDPLAICQTCCTPNPYRDGDA
ncbi:hypothetical protein [Micrococcus luteus]|uniref:hypothetical protein n=1 Tax=Micrococcus luteus TaxID=1270 RepID=UPI0023025D8B|nr:hypothetical protein [Micrococcus luteus]